MRKFILIAAFAAVAVAGINHVVSAFLAYKAPVRPVKDFSRETPACAIMPMNGNAFVRSPMECEERLLEAKRLARHPGLVTRHGDNLTIFRYGKQVAYLVPDEITPNACDAYTLHNFMPVQMASNLEYVPEISCHMGEFERRFIVMPDGDWWHVNGALASPTGRRIGVGQNYPADDGFPGFTLYEWPSRKEIVRFEPRCRVVSWQSDSDLTVTCLHEWKTWGFEQWATFDARVWRDESGRWRMRTTRWLKYHRGFSEAGDEENMPAFSLRWPMTFEPVK